MEKRFDMILGKQRARARLREFIGKHLHSRKNARVLCLPGEHGREIEHVYRKLGFRDENITGIEADLASVKGVQEHYPHITVHEGTVAEYAKQEAIRCIESEAKPRPFSVVSLDYCGVFSRDKLEFLSTMAALGHLSDNVVIAVNLFAGRESQVNQKEMREALACRLSFERKDPRISNVTQYLSTARGAELDDARDVCTALNVEDFVCHQAAGRRMCFHGPYSHCRHVKVDWLSPTMRQSMVWSIEHNGLDQAKLLLGDHLPVFAIDACMNELIEQLAEAAKHLPPRMLANDSTDVIERRVWIQGINCGDFLVHKHGPGYYLTAAERYSYINDAGHRMNSDYLYFRRVDQQRINRIRDWAVVDDDGFLQVCPEICAMEPVEKILHIQALCQAFVPLLKDEMKIDEVPERIHLGGGAIPMDSEKVRQRITHLIQRGKTDDEIMSRYPVTVGSLRAYRAHVTRGTYEEVAGRDR